MMENSGEGFDWMPMEEDYSDNLSISLDRFYKILEEPAPPTQNFSECCNPEQLDFDLRNSEALHPQSGNYPDFWSSSLGAPNCFVESECKATAFIETVDDNHPQSSQRFYCSGLSSLPSVYSPSCLKPSFADFVSSAMNSYAGSFGSGVVNDGVEFHELQTNSNKCSGSPGLEPSLLKTGGKSNADSGSMHDMLEKSGCNNASFCDVNQAVMPDTELQNVNIKTNSESCRPADLMETLLYKINSIRNDNGWIIDSCDANNSSLTIQGDSFIGPEITSRTSIPVQEEALAQHKKVKLRGMSGEGAWSNCLEKCFECTVQEPSPCRSLLEGSVEGLDSSLPCGFCAEKCMCEVVMSESSTDSSPLPCSRNPTSLNLEHCSTNTSVQAIFNPKAILQSNGQNTLLKDTQQTKLPTCHQWAHKVSKIAKVAVQSNPAQRNKTLDDDMDLFILDDISDPAPAPPIVHAKTNPLAQHSTFSDYNASSGTLRLSADDERLTFRLALQDLSQPKSEVNPPDGVLSVSLLRHQRIALSWMVQKETVGLNCCGGILADDQGLGKTVSTIALILTEGPRSSPSCSITQEKCVFEPLNLDDGDDDGSSYAFEGKERMLCKASSTVMNVAPVNMGSSCATVKGRPAAGTLVVCPTSVLRQWAEELQNKITSKANLSFLVYHGSNRTKDANELTKFDVVLTTYAIVSMEVPKQPLVDKDDMEKGKQDGCSLDGSSAIKKRKEYPCTTLNQKNSPNGLQLESASRPLSKVGWFRIILDEAQSIKNHRTQVARACWGLRAKRRWCLSGTPIQNAVDDLYSYFRFLRYDPYASYKSFCSKIKMPISRNPTNGYKKLQAVLKTIMLRRTKATFIDGKPIITLPPKIVNLKRVDFSKEEHDFYLALEAESREQFKVYADAGTVQQNYVNILLMLLRLRQACDHPLLVKGYNSSSVWNSSVESAKKLPRDKQTELLRCIEAGLEICSLCNDPPEDVVVSICGHVFCNQCVCEYLLADDNICPSAKCRVKLSSTSVFSRETLKRSLSEQHTDLRSDNFSPDVGHMPKLSLQNMCSDSSKIRATLEILLSLPVSQCSTTQSESAKSTHKPLVNEADKDSFDCSFDSATDQQQNLPSWKFKRTEKAIVFSQWTRMLDLLEVSLKHSCLHYRRLDGTMSVAARERAIKDFNLLPEVTVIIMSLKAASLGLNMVVASHVVLLDLWWNPTTEDQAIDRAHRIGQTRPVTVSRLTVRGTVEDRILALQEKKREMVSSAFGEDESGSRQTRLTVEDMRYLFMV